MFPGLWGRAHMVLFQMEYGEVFFTIPGNGTFFMVGTMPLKALGHKEA